MCGSTQWPRGGFSIIGLSRRFACQACSTGRRHRTQLKNRGLYLKIAIAHDRRVVHRGAGRTRSTAACRPTSAASSISVRGAGPSFGHRCIGAPAGTCILATARCRTLSIRIQARAVALPVALTRRQRQRVRVMRGGHAASRNEVDDTTGLPAIVDAPPRREIRDRPTRHGTGDIRPGARRPAASLRRCNDRARFAGIRCDIPVSRDACDYRRLKNTARFLRAISSRIAGNGRYRSCRKVVFATD